LKSLERIAKGDRHRAQGIHDKIELLRDDPLMPGTRQLVGQRSDEPPVRRLRSGPYRVLYAVDTGRRTIQILDIAHRKDVYRDL
jgi:mRNA-degrading endonuclease RelE of RelBE toxin-antitoxin system